MKTEQMGTLRPVTQRENAQGTAVKYAVDPIGDITAAVRYVENDELGITQVLDDVALPFTDVADGFGLYDQGGTLLSWWAFIAAPGEELRLEPGWGFKTHGAIGAGQSERAETVAR